jgi:hypothetical protein
MTTKIIIHFMPWEIDYALLTFTQLKRSKYYLPEGCNVEIETILNLSSYTVDWNNSKLPKEFFQDKYDQISNLLIDYKHIKRVYDGDQLYGHLDLQKECIEPHIDYYIGICPDTYFSEHLLGYMLQAAQAVSNKYFVITPQICRMWDQSWEVLTHPKFAVGPHYGWEKTSDIFDVDYHLHNSQEDVSLTPIDQLKWAGWFDLFNKDMYENLVRVPDQWSGYGAWDNYGLHVCRYAKQIGLDFQQYRLDGQIAFEYSIGPLRTDNIHGFSNYYKNFLIRRDVSEQRDNFDKNLPHYVNQKLKQIHEQVV